MSIGLITATNSIELEDKVIEALCHEGFQLAARAFNSETLNQIMAELPQEERFLVIHDESISLSIQQKQKWQSEFLAFLEIKVESNPNHEEIRKAALERTREPEVSEQPKFVRTVIGSWIGFTGSTGSPGVSTLAMNIAAEMSLSQRTVLVDAAINRRDLAPRFGMKSGGALVSLNASLELIDLPQDTSEQIWENKFDLVCADLGAAPSISQSLSDRRMVSRNYLKNLERCRTVIYVATPESYAIDEMASFALDTLRNFPDTNILFVLNKFTNSTRQQGLKKSFRTAVKEFDPSREIFVLPHDHQLLDRAQARFATVLEVSPHSSLRKSMRALSIYLSNSL